MGMIDQALAKIYEAGGYTAAIGSQLGKDADQAFRQHHGIGRSKPAPTPTAPASDELKKSIPADLEESIQNLESLAKAQEAPRQAPKAKPQAEPKKPQELPLTANKQQIKRGPGWPEVPLKNLNVVSLNQEAIHKKFGPVPTDPKARSEYAAQLLRSGIPGHRVKRIMGFK